MARTRERLRAIARHLQGTVNLWHLLRSLPEEEALAYGVWRHQRFTQGLPSSVELFVQHVTVKQRLIGRQPPAPPPNRRVRG